MTTLRNPPPSIDFAFQKLKRPDSELSLSRERVFDVSIIMPVYNVEPFLAAAIDSVISQVTQFSFELVIIDDASTDRSRAIIENYLPNDVIQFIPLTNNRGLGGARNMGIDHANGLYLTFLDSDDLLLPGALSHLLNTAKGHDSDLVCARHTSFETESQMPVLPSRLAITPVDKGSDYRQVSGFAWSKLFHYSLFEKVRFPEKVAFEDAIIIPLIVDSAKRGVLSDRPVVAYRWRPNSLSKRASIIQGDFGLDHFEGVMYVIGQRSATEAVSEIYRSYLIDQVGSAFKSRSFYMSKKRLSGMLKIFATVLASQQFESRSWIERLIVAALNNGSVSAWRLVCKFKRWNDKRSLVFR